MKKLSFSGHESFICKQFWLKKGYDFINTNKKFSDNAAVVDLGVGKNMVSSIRFWLKAFGITDENDQLQQIADYIFGSKGIDTFIEDIATLWLLHNHLIKQGRASIYNLIFNYFRKETFDFTKEQLHSYLKRKCDETKSQYNSKTIKTDINVFLKNYLKPNNGYLNGKSDRISVEDDFIGLLQDLDLIKQYRLPDAYGKEIDYYKIENEQRPNLPYQIVLYTILDNPNYISSITFRELYVGFNSPGLTFALGADGLYNKIIEIVENYEDITFTETAGNQVMQFKTKPDKFEVLDGYYKK